MTAGDDSRAVEAWASEQVRVDRWRLSEFLHMGYDVDAAQALASSDADLRRVESMIAAGCSLADAREISL